MYAMNTYQSFGFKVDIVLGFLKFTIPSPQTRASTFSAEIAATSQ